MRRTVIMHRGDHGEPEVRPHSADAHDVLLDLVGRGVRENAAADDERALLDRRVREAAVGGDLRQRRFDGGGGWEWQARHCEDEGGFAVWRERGGGWERLEGVGEG